VKLLNETLTHVYEEKGSVRLDERHISYKTLTQFRKIPFCPVLMERFDEFSNGLNEINNQQFKDKTCEFRDRRYHRLPPKIEMGLSSIVTRIDIPGVGIQYALGGQLPLRIADLIPLLLSEQEKCVSAFDLLWSLTNEQLKEWQDYTIDRI
jgi:hypothetical protein